MFLNGFGASQDNNEAAFTEAARRIYNDAGLTVEQHQQMIVQAFYDTGVSLEFAAMTFDIPVSDVQTVIDRYVNTVVFSPPMQAPTQAELRAAAQAAEAARQAQLAAEAARQAQQAIENAKNSSNPVFDPPANEIFCPPGSKLENGVCVTDPSTYGPVQTGTTGASPALLLVAIAASLLLGG